MLMESLVKVCTLTAHFAEPESKAAPQHSELLKIKRWVILKMLNQCLRASSVLNLCGRYTSIMAESLFPAEWIRLQSLISVNLHEGT